ncbi:hypothetical protein PpBr36_03889 [Pyricularia pennisetigena]|uniref:hypothetical protein n=1 Tax=Pyricularia pennisetigena TaxID=1578925 RepID=UPI00114F8720|nr:hypothetical protein PpBr36_03889 [Pyricularia pennisetigena]TLS29980.1 hypothetical protein PpBr36_03889 [Pyricularia pennisetigena]
MEENKRIKGVHNTAHSCWRLAQLTCEVNSGSLKHSYFADVRRGKDAVLAGSHLGQRRRPHQRRTRLLVDLSVLPEVLSVLCQGGVLRVDVPAVGDAAADHGDYFAGAAGVFEGIRPRW